jgi:serine/threonine protein phosphatase PrpC
MSVAVVRSSNPPDIAATSYNSIPRPPSDLSTKENWWGHRVLVIAKKIPVISSIIAVIERITAFIYDRWFNTEANSAPLNLPHDPLSQDSVRNAKILEKANLEEAGKELEELHSQQAAPSPSEESFLGSLKNQRSLNKMLKNAKKAIEEHRIRHSKSTCYASVEEALPELKELLKNKDRPLTLMPTFDAEQGRRKTMEDAHFINETDKDFMAGVFDGHGDSKVAEHANQHFRNLFEDEMKNSNGNVRKSFEKTLDSIHEEVLKNGLHSGSTAVICYIDKKAHVIYTATLGDSEANVYRAVEKTDKSIPLSCVRDWSSKKDAARAAKFLEDDSIKVEWPQSQQPKALRFPYPHAGINVSRAIGDADFMGTEEKPGLIHKPKIAVNLLHPGDVIVIACDGLKDYVSEDEILHLIKNPKQGSTLSQQLVHFAFEKRHSGDNITVITATVS